MENTCRRPPRIISLLPTKDGARTQTLATRWRHLWLAAPLSLDVSGIPAANQDALSGVISRVLAAHPGPARRFSVPALHLYSRPETVSDWLRSPALSNLQELEFHVGVDSFGTMAIQRLSLLVSTSQFSTTLRVLTISRCHLLDGAVETLHFPQHRYLGLERCNISGGSLHGVIDGCPVLQYLLLKDTYGFGCLRINSPTLISLFMSPGEVIIQDAPLLESLLQHNQCQGLRALVISAPNLKTLGSLSGISNANKLVFDTTIIQNLCALSFTTAVCSVKMLAISMYSLSLDMVINLMRCFPCLEKLYIESCFTKHRNLWRRKHRNLIRCFDIRLKTVVLKKYRGIKSQVNFASFFVLNAKMLELMRFEGQVYNDNQMSIAEHRRLLQLDKRASRGARFSFTTGHRCHHNLCHVEHVSDLSGTNPFECTC